MKAGGVVLRSRRIAFPAGGVRIAFMLFTIYMLVASGAQELRLLKLQREKAYYERQLRTVEMERRLLTERIQELQSDAYIERVAREELGLVKPGEVPYVATPSRPAE